LAEKSTYDKLSSLFPQYHLHSNKKARAFALEVLYASVNYFLIELTNSMLISFKNIPKQNCLVQTP